MQNVDVSPSVATVTSIRAIDRNTVHRICAGQVVVDLATALKELVENSLDAEATVIEVKLKEMGAESFEVTDNGSGIRKTDYEGVAKKHYTSKIEDFSDLNSVKSFGFRGEALNALNELSKCMTVTTKREDDVVGSQLTFERDGSLKSCKPIARGTKGTTVVVEKLFDSLPVRRNEFVRNIKKQYAKLLKVLQSYAVVSTGVKFSIVNITKDSKQVILATQCSNSMADNISSVFGSKFLSTLIKTDIDCCSHSSKSGIQSSSVSVAKIDGSDMDLVDEDLGDDDSIAINSSTIRYSINSTNNDDNNNNNNSCDILDHDADKNNEISECNTNIAGTSSSINSSGFIKETRILGYISKAGSGVGRNDNDRQFIYVNGRPVDLPRITKVLNEVWRRYEMKHKPAFIMDIKVPAGSFDVNLTPDKREVVLVHEKYIIDILRDVIDDLYMPSRYTFPVASQPKFSFGLGSQLSQSALDLTEKVNMDLEEELKEHVEEEEKAVDDKTMDGKSVVNVQLGKPDKKIMTEEEALAEYDRLMSGSESLHESIDCINASSKHDNSSNSPIETSGVGEKRMYRELEDESIDNQSKKTDSLNSTVVWATDNQSNLMKSSQSSWSPNKSTERITRNSVSKDIQSIRDNDSSDDNQCEEIIFVKSNSKSNSNYNDNRGLNKIEDTEIKSSYEISVSNVNTKSNSNNKNSNNNTFNSLLQSNATWAFNPDHVLSDFHNTLNSKKSCKDPALTTFNGNKGNASSIDLFSREDALSRMITKQDFPNMKVIGQFNLGFMICELRGDMYILDQHACDEKYRFETLQQTTSIHQQPLISPLTVETNAAEEIIIMENLKIFEANGFKLRICEDEPPGSRIKLLSVPLSKSVQFNTDDVHELASFLSDESSGYLTKLILKNDINPNLGNSKGDKNMIRLPKLAAMFASRACRSAVMIGTALSNSEMRGIVDRLATIDQPWNCPHGRPTMRHLFDLSSYYEGQKQLPY